MHPTSNQPWWICLLFPLRKFSPWIMLIRIRSSTLCLGFEKPFFFVWVKKNTSWSGWLCGCCFLWMGLFGVAFETKGKGRIEGGGARWTQKKKLFSWSEMGWVGLCHPSDTHENFRPFIGVILYNSSYDDIVAHLVGEVCDGWCESKIHSI